MTRWKLTIEYDGGPFFGWQRQTDDPSVQAALERAIGAITSTAITVHGAGRTDAGVHALGMVAHVDIDRAITPFRLREGINALVRPDPVSVLNAEAVADDWHARFSCTGRRYLYRILTRRPPPALDRGRVWHVGKSMDVEAMEEAAAHLIGTHDFTTFRSAHCQSASPIKSLDSLKVEWFGDEVHIHAAARSFLHHQVRSISGCLGLVGIGKWSPADMKAALEAKDRAALGLNAPPEGLYFVEALYPS
jgi:tRNA pseudouridine38-40 synthase